MVAPPSLVSDPRRLAALDAYGILDTPSEQGFDDIVHIASHICRTPAALVSLVAADRQWFKARVGFPSCETDLSRSVCAHALVEPDLLVIPDLRQDPRTRDNPLVTGEPFIRFYAGAPLRAPGGAAIGSLCVIDLVPRPDGLSESQTATLQALARQVMAQMELRRAVISREALLLEQQAALSEIEALNAAQAAIAAAGGDLDTILDAVLAGAMKAIPAAEAGVVELIDGAEMVYRAVQGTVTPFLGTRLPIRGSLAGTCAFTNTPLLLPDALEDPRIQRDLAERVNLRSVILVPVSRGEQVLGVLKMHSSIVGALGDGDLRQARLFAGVASAGLAEAREAETRAALRESERTMAALVDLGDRLRATDRADSMAFAAAEIMGRTLEATRAGYGTMSLTTESVEITTDWHQPDRTSLVGVHRFRDYGSFIEDLKRGEIVVVEDVDKDERTRANAGALAGLGIRSLVNVPLIEHGVLVALIYVHHDQPHAWSEGDFGFVRDVADRTRAAVARVAAEEQQRLLNGELSHRLKNTLTMVLSIATQTLRAVPDRVPVEAFERRVLALASAHDVLLRQNWSAAPLREVVDIVLQGVGQTEQIDIDGPPVQLGSRAALSFSLVLHELATNAAKYGGLSNETGRVGLTWRLEGQGANAEVVMDWREHGGPAVEPPTRRGFGSRLIRTGLAGSGGVELRYPPEGFQAEMRAPLLQLQQI